MRQLEIFYCFYCGEALSRKRKTKDHKLPRSKGGSNGHNNIVDACRTCNGEKGNLLLEEFRIVVALRHGLVAPTNFKFPGELEINPDDYKKKLKRKKINWAKKASITKQDHENRKQCFAYYGFMCNCCHQSFDEIFLTLNQVNKTEKYFEASQLYKWAIKHKYPTSLKPYCWNCSMAKAINGVCLHTYTLTQRGLKNPKEGITE